MPDGRMRETALAELISFRELDDQAGLPKGRAFRVFKRLDPPLRENEDFLLLNSDQDSDTIAGLRRQGRIYASSIQVVLLKPAAARRIADRLAGNAP